MRRRVVALKEKKNKEVMVGVYKRESFTFGMVLSIRILRNLVEEEEFGYRKSLVSGL